MSVTYDYKVRTSYTDDIEAKKRAHKVLLEVPFEPSLPERGYTNRTLFIDLSKMTVTEKKVTEEMKEIFVGGRGFGLWYLWNAIKPTTKWNDPENEIIISPGPLAGNTQYAGSGKSLVVTLSPLTGIPIDSNVGGYFGPLMKFCGFDALEIAGKAPTDVVLVIDGPRKTITIEDGTGGEPRQPRRRRAVHLRVRRQREGLRQRLGGVGRPRRRPQPHRLPELLVVGSEARRRAAEAGGPGRHRARSSATRGSRRSSCTASR